jgi:hypothetical protein
VTGGAAFAVRAFKPLPTALGLFGYCFLAADVGAGLGRTLPHGSFEPFLSKILLLTVSRYSRSISCSRWACSGVRRPFFGLMG